LNPAPKVGGLEISDSAVRYVLISEKSPFTISLKLPPGVIEGGQLKDRKTFVAALRDLRRRIPEKSGHILHVIVVLPASSVYSQVINIPIVTKNKISEAAKLNLQMVSPIEIEEAYYDYQMLGEAIANTGEYEIFGAFVRKAIVDEYLGALEEAAIKSVIIEPPALALSRFLDQEGGVDSKKPHFILEATNDGLQSSILFNSQVYLSHFTYWRTVEEEGGLNQFLNMEIRRIISHFVNACRCQVENAIIIGHALTAEIEKAFAQSFSDIKVRPIALKTVSELSPIWFVGFGAAMRGKISRRKDYSLTLTPFGAEESYFRALFLNFIRLWRNMIVSALGVVLVVFIFGDALLARTAASLSHQITSGANQTLDPESLALFESAKEFNALLGAVDEIRLELKARPQILTDLASIIGGYDIITDRLSISRSGDIIISGRAKNESAIIDFRRAIEANPAYIEVDFPLTAIKIGVDDQFTFIMNFKAAP